MHCDIIAHARVEHVCPTSVCPPAFSLCVLSHHIVLVSNLPSRSRHAIGTGRESSGGKATEEAAEEDERRRMKRLT